MIILKELFNLISECVFDSGKESEKDLFYKRTHFLGNVNNTKLNEYDLSSGEVNTIRSTFLNENELIDGDYFLVQRDRTFLTYVITCYFSFEDLQKIKNCNYDNNIYDENDTYIIYKNKLYFYKKFDYNINKMILFTSRLYEYHGEFKELDLIKFPPDRSYLNLRKFKERNIFIYYSFFFNKYVIGLNENDCKKQFLSFLDEKSIEFEKLIESGETNLYTILLDIDYLKNKLCTNIEE